MYSSRMRATRSLTISHSIQGGLPTPHSMQTSSEADPPKCRSPSLLDADAPGCRPPPLVGRPPLNAEPPRGRPPSPTPTPEAEPPGHLTCDACWEANPHPLWTGGMTHTCKNITLP